MECDYLNCSGLKRECVLKKLYSPYGGDEDICIYYMRAKLEFERNLEKTLGELTSP